MTQYVVLADWSRTLEVTDTVPPQIKKFRNYTYGDVIDLDPENDLDVIDIERLTVEPHAALVEKSVFDQRNRQQEAAARAVAAARGASLIGPTATDPAVAATEGYPEGQRFDGPATTVGAGGTDPEPQGFGGEASGTDYDDEEEWSYSDLQTAAKTRGLSAGGSRIELVQRVRAFDEANAAELTKRAVAGTLDDDDKNVALRNT